MLVHRLFYAVSLPLTVVGVVYTLHYVPSRGTSWLVKVMFLCET